ncbi:hypothetical protein HXX76_000035 [Chlamydomonas incerta]|uniref:BACK domain-containing protein n=1 Tax=Chlamydomonas incerta TaxID=51695 RepID=A0A835WDK2_CHLIN|nr:hypothetical protein HXX76_000035 [Chlamydomonas incerta]|eukprot:KAG2445413.1 hypothetical protein HXX76_000035 [Chlamydomonas incerta]
MAPPINSRVAAAISGLFGRSDGADCRLVFVRDPAPRPGEPACDGSAGGSGGPSQKQVLGEPVPAHSFVLRFASDKLAAQLEWAAEIAGAGGSACPSEKARASGAAATSAAPQKQLPEVQLMLGGEEELPAARAAIQFAYTGRVQAGVSVREALQVRRQAAYLQMEGCAAACLEAVKEALVHEGSAGPAAAAGSSNALEDTAACSGGNTPVLELYGCAALWPEPAEDAAFAALLADAKRRLVAHFGDALAVLNSPERYEQMVALPAVGLEALLESDDFGTDSESSVVLLLAEWMAANYATTDQALRRRLCGPLRWMHCSRAYLSGVLPELAARHQRSPASAAGWFPVSSADARCMRSYSRASEPVRQAMDEGRAPWRPPAGMSMMPAGWLNRRPRRHCLPAEGRPFEFGASLTEIEQSFAVFESGRVEDLEPRVPRSRLGDCVVAQGFAWQPYLRWGPGGATAGVFIRPREPAALAATAASSGGGGAAAEGGLAGWAFADHPRMRLSVHGADGHEAWSGQFGRRRGPAFVLMRSSVGWREALELPKVAINQQPSNGAGSSSSSSSSKVAACWAPYLQGGTRLAGSVVLPPPAYRAPAARERV